MMFGVRTLPDISIRQLEYLVAIADHHTWGEAAASIGVSASALSQGLAELERRIGVDLFERDGRRRRLRPTAQPVLDHARQVVGLTGDLMAWSDRVRTARTGEVAVGMIDVAAVERYPDVLRSYMAERPDVELRLTVAPSAGLLGDVLSGRLDLAVCVEPTEAVPGIATEPLQSEPIAIYAPAGTRIGRPATWGPWVLFPDGSHTRERIIERLRDVGAPLQVVADSHQPDVIREMVALGFGWTALPESSEAGDDLVRGPDLFERQLVLARRAGSVTDPAADELASRLMAKSG